MEMYFCKRAKDVKWDALQLDHKTYELTQDLNHPRVIDTIRKSLHFGDQRCERNLRKHIAEKLSKNGKKVAIWGEDVNRIIRVIQNALADAGFIRIDLPIIYDGVYDYTMHRLVNFFNWNSDNLEIFLCYLKNRHNNNYNGVVMDYCINTVGFAGYEIDNTWEKEFGHIFFQTTLEEGLQTLQRLERIIRIYYTESLKTRKGYETFNRNTSENIFECFTNFLTPSQKQFMEWWLHHQETGYIILSSQDIDTRNSCIISFLANAKPILSQVRSLLKV